MSEPKRRRLSRTSALLLLILALVTARAGAQTAVPGPCATGTLPAGALALVCIPASGWTGDLIVYAHGYTAPQQPLDFQGLTLTDGTYLPDLVQSLGYALATTSYRRNGLAILEGVDDVRQLVQAFPAVAGRPAERTYLTGVSEGGLITALLAERSPELFSGGLTACGPVGDFRRQIDHLGDFRVLFDYFFPGLLPSSAVEIPPGLIEAWESRAAEIRSALAGNPSAAGQLLAAAKTPAAPDASSTAVSVLWYNVFGTNDARAQLRGNPFENRERAYTGSSDDALLNQGVARFAADPVALSALGAYETSGRVAIPLVALHTTGDEVVPFWHQTLYQEKVRQAGGRAVTLIPVERAGHCNFTTLELLLAFSALVQQVVGR